MTEFPDIFPTIEFYRARLKADPRDQDTIAVMVENAKWFLSDDYVCDETSPPPPPGPDAEIEASRRFYRWLEIACLAPSAAAFDVLKDMAVAMLGNHKRLPECLETFASKVLSGELKRTKKGRDKFKNETRDERLWRATELIADQFGVGRYTNNDLFDGVTAAEIVSLAAGCSVDVVINVNKARRRKLGIRKLGVK